MIWTDVFQLFFMFLSTGYIIFVATQQAGGPAKVVEIRFGTFRHLSSFVAAQFAHGLSVSLLKMSPFQMYPVQHLHPSRWWIGTLTTPGCNCSTWPLTHGRGEISARKRFEIGTLFDLKLARHTLWGTMFGAGIMWMSVFGVSQTQVLSAP